MNFTRDELLIKCKNKTELLKMINNENTIKHLHHLPFKMSDF